jgi:hypothetical protein
MNILSLPKTVPVVEVEILRTQCPENIWPDPQVNSQTRRGCVLCPSDRDGTHDLARFGPTPKHFGAKHPNIADSRWHGNTAGPKRNRAMVEAGAEMCVGLHRDIKASKGTKDCVRQALAAKIPTYLIDDDQGVAKRLDAGEKRLK